jgi:hypothetical protein
MAADVPAKANVDSDVKNIVDSIEALSGVFDNLESATEQPKAPESKAPGVDAKQERSLKKSVAIIAAGAAAGASIGAATKKGPLA